MSAVNFAAALAFTLQCEGGWSDNPDDPGGCTMKGITLATFEGFYPGATADELRAITDDQIQHIYSVGYWAPVHGDELPSGVDLSVFDFGVNAGPRRSRELLQQAVGVTVDGTLGPISMAAINAASPSAVIAALAGLQKSYYQGLDGWDEFGAGWSARNERRAVAAMALISGAST